MLRFTMDNHLTKNTDTFLHQPSIANLCISKYSRIISLNIFAQHDITKNKMCWRALTSRHCSINIVDCDKMIPWIPIAWL